VVRQDLIITKVVWVKKRFLSFLKKIMCRAVRAVVCVRSVSLVKVGKWRALSLLKFLHSHINCQFSSLVDIVVYDRPQRALRYTVIYSLLSAVFNKRVFVIVYTKNELKSVCSIYAGGGWSEREAWDLFGVFFSRHLDLRKLLTDYGFNHHPLRKDFPLSGYKEIFYSEKEKRVLQRRVELSQAYRVFLFKPIRGIF
jgi:NADH:ubiquinone oxidoreductase subunit C